ncbi:MAG: YlxR family protein [Bacilli bacterium]|nr:YlxR family protein [Bacilli bacterium]
MKEKRIPLRKCVATNEQHPKGEMFRVVRTNEGEILIDLTGKVRGRGAYLSKSKAAINKAKKKKILDRHLEVAVPDEVYDELLKRLGDVFE